ncbi:arginine-tRNA-protein transferase 1 [Ostreococcus tauri]|uniref:arginyltransferase n=1 Tax=Ostreococcus tauri TaxID=70448 RepID=A0A1Y5IEX6_OSTTA|nr:arginine-tRNA-protein transferase 1 [Ostreococcus tauri]OUS46754.1 arginine-tRNA-protein transferase 1 [Ostreococcus tauri]
MAARDVITDAVSYAGRHASTCGYCASTTNTSVADGAIAHRLTTAVYNDLIEDGWRRSGRYVYKPVIGTTCCATHVIRLRCVEFTLSKSQRKVMRRIARTTARTSEDEDDGSGTAAANERLEITTARSSFVREEYELYERYQTSVHGDAPEDVSVASYRRFLVDSPFDDEPPGPGTPSTGFGAFHQQYRIGGKLVAVGVVDILPKGLSSKYFFWDPDYARLSLGKVSALKEIAFVLEEQRRGARGFDFYYMGYYIHDCPKMRYKAEYAPSEIRCSTTRRWVHVDDEDVRRRLDVGEHRLLSDEPALERAMCPVEDSLVGVSMRGHLIGVCALREFPSLAKSLVLFGNLNYRDVVNYVTEEQTEWCNSAGTSALRIVNVIAVERASRGELEDDDTENEGSEDDEMY